jgi:hypothetical protein
VGARLTLLSSRFSGAGLLERGAMSVIPDVLADAGTVSLADVGIFTMNCALQ